MNIWDWMYRVAYDEAVYQQVCLSLNDLALQPNADAHVAIMQEKLAVFSQLLSLAQLVDACVTANVQPLSHSPSISAMIQRAREVPPLHLPEFLAVRYEEKLFDAKHLTSEEVLALKGMIHSAVATPWVNHHQAIFEPIFGQDTLNALLLLSDQNRLPVSFPMKDEPLSSAIDVSLVDKVIADLYAHYPTVLGHKPTYNVTIQAGLGWAEYWPKLLTKAANDQLIIYDNADQRGCHTFRATLAHEVLGHGEFYTLAEYMRPNFFDHGAMALIEGWATWCEWHYADPAWGRYLSAMRCHGLRHFDGMDAERTQTDIRNFMAKVGYSVEAAESSIEYFFQYPGFSMAYTLGALWFEAQAEKQSIEPVFDLLKQHGLWGDFFRLWSF